MTSNSKSNLDLVHDVKEVKCQICKRTDEESYNVVISAELGLVEITCNNCWMKEIRRKLHEVIEEEFA